MCFKVLLFGFIIECGDIFRIIEECDILLYFFYEWYNFILVFFNQVVVDFGVIDIYIVLYCVVVGSYIVNVLISVVNNGKKVIVFVELKVCFDEVNNICWSWEMKKVGVWLIYSMLCIKVYLKIVMVIKRDKGE